MEKKLICLDTSVLIDYFRKKNKANSFFYKLSNDYDLFAVSTITEYEIYFGSNVDQDLYWNDFFSKIISLPYNSQANKVAISVDRELRKKKMQLDIPDLMIAGTAIANHLELATLNPKHFERIANLKIITPK